MQPEDSLTLAAPAAAESRQRSGLLVMRVLYFLYFGGVGVYFTFVNVYLSDTGLSGTQIGLVNTLAPLVGIFASTLWGMLNDRLGNPRLLLLIATPGTILAAQLIGSTHSFGLIVLYVALMSLFQSAIPALMDNTTLRLLGERSGRYGAYRVAGSFGFILASLVAGVLFERIGLHWIFAVYGLVMGVYLLAASRLPIQPIRLSGSLWGGLGQMVRQRAWLLFAVSATLLWISNNGTMNFIGITIRAMGGSDALIGMVWMTSAIAEIPIMLAGDWLLRRVGHTRLLVIAFLTFTLRAALLALMPAPEWALWINMLSGVSFGFFWMSAVAYANETTPEHLKSTSQGLLYSILNVANMAGALSSGALWDKFGPHGLFWGMAAFSAAGLVVFVVGRKRGVGK